MSKSSCKHSWFSSVFSVDRLFRVKDEARKQRPRFCRPQMEVLEERLAPAVDLSQFATFLPAAVNAIQTYGVNDELYNLSLPLIANALSALAEQSGSPALFLSPVEDVLTSGFQASVPIPRSNSSRTR